ncbi:MAG: hypothetical protein EON55_22570, partial [Alphaproteobacteria bacterium]
LMKIVIAEKPSVGRELAKVFGATTRKDGYIEGKGYSFTWAFGRIVRVVYHPASIFHQTDTHRNDGCCTRSKIYTTLVEDG